MGGKKKNAAAQKAPEPKKENVKEEMKVSEAKQQASSVKSAKDQADDDEPQIETVTENSRPVEPSDGLTTEQAAEEAEEEVKQVSILLYDLNMRPIRLRMMQTEMVLELREFLTEHVYTCFFTNYQLEYRGHKLNEFSDLSALDAIDLELDGAIKETSNQLEDVKTLYMKPQLYTEAAARLQIKRTTELLTTPCLLTAQQNVSKEEEHLSNMEAQARKDGLTTAELSKKQEEYIKEIQAAQEEKQRKLYESFVKIVEHDQENVEVPEIQEGSGKGAQERALDLMNSTIEKTTHNQGSNPYTKCIESISYSQFNPVPQARRLAGDLFYLTIKTTDAGEKGVTCTVNGFYLNDSTERSVFSPGPSQKTQQNEATGRKTQGAFSYTLAGLIHQISPSFGKNLEAYFNQLLTSESYFVMQPQVKTYSWICNDDRKPNQSSDQASMNEVVVPLHGLDPKGIRDWNEEYQVVKDFPKETDAQRNQRDRTIIRIYNDFVKAATEGAIAIIKGSIQPLNPSERRSAQVFVFNLIFFSFAHDGYDSFKDQTNGEQNPSWTQANHDMAGLRQLQLLEIDGLYYVATVIINYRGERVIAQSIIPGILNNSELPSLSEYGTIDEQQTINSSEQFHGLMKQVAERMHIQVNKIRDGTGKEVEIAGSCEVKGIRGTDKRAYVVDLQGMTPRDGNYMGEEYHTCLVRQELVLLYHRHKCVEHAKEKMKDVEKELEAEFKEKEAALGIEEKKELTDEQKKKLQELYVAKRTKQAQKFEEFFNEVQQDVFNTNVLKSNINLAMPVDQIKAEEDKVLELSAFLKINAIQNLTKNLQKNEGVPTDSKSLSEFFHQNGVNMRYLGHVQEQLKDKNMTQLKNLVERETLLRCMKHIFAKQLRECTSEEMLAPLVSHLLNCLLAPAEFQKLMDEKKIVAKPESLAEKSAANKPDPVNEGKDSQQVEAVNEQPLSKKEKKRRRRGARGPGGEEEKEEDDGANELEIKSVHELLFKNQQLTDQQFDAGELFKETDISHSLFSVHDPSPFEMTPTELFAEIKRLAKSRYSYTVLPDKLHEVKSLSSTSGKMALLRDICLCVGITLNLRGEGLELVLDNDPQQMRKELSLKLQRERLGALKSKKKDELTLANVQVLPDEELLVVGNLPFTSQHIADFFPVLKQLNYMNKTAQTLVQEGKNVAAEGQLEKAFEMYSQGTNYLLQVTGAMTAEVAAVITKMANVQYKFRDCLQAIELQSKAIIIQEKVLGFDDPTVAYSYSNLGLYFHTCQHYSKGFECMQRAIKILSQVCGDNHPDISSIYLNMGLMYQDAEMMDRAISAFKESLFRNMALYGECHLQVNSCYQAIAHAYYMHENFRMALEYQEKSLQVLKQLMPPESEFVVHAKRQMDQYMALSVQQEKEKQAAKGGQRAIGSNKAKLTDAQRREALERQQFQQYLQQLAQGAPQGTGSQGAGLRAGARSGLVRGGAARGGLLDMLEQRARVRQLQELFAKKESEAAANAAAGESGGVQWIRSGATTDRSEGEADAQGADGAAKKKKKKSKK